MPLPEILRAAQEAVTQLIDTCKKDTPLYRQQPKESLAYIRAILSGQYDHQAKRILNLEIETPEAHNRCHLCLYNFTLFDPQPSTTGELPDESIPTH